MPVFNKELACVVFAAADCIIQRGLTILVDDIRLRTVGSDESAYYIHMTLARGIEKWALYIAIQVVRAAAGLSQEVNQAKFAFSACVEKWCLI